MPGDSLLAIDSRVEFDDCSLIGPDAEATPPSEAKAGGIPLRMAGGRLTAARTVFQAGVGGEGLEFVPGYCMDPAAGGNAIVAEGPGVVPMELFGCTLLPGAGGWATAPCGGWSAPGGVEFAGAGVGLSAISNAAFALGFDAAGRIPSRSATSVSVLGVETLSSKWMPDSLTASPLNLLEYTGFAVWTAGSIHVLTLPPNGTQAVIFPSLPPGGHRGFLLQGLELPSDLVPVLHPARIYS